MLKKLYEKSRLIFSIVWIVSYCILFSVGDAISASLGIEKIVTFVIGVLLSVVLLLFLKRNGLFREYGLCRSIASARSMLYYLPLIFILTVNIWFGIQMNYTVPETLFYIGSMLCVGFLEEIIFRGLLFNAMRGENPRLAVVISSLTFGIGHIINLVNGSGADFFANLLQVIYATAAGFMFVMIYIKTESLVTCIAFHGCFNALSAFSVTPDSLAEKLLPSAALTVVSILYAIYIAKAIRGRKIEK